VQYEEWRYVVNYPEYSVSNLGNIRRTGATRGRPLTLRADDEGVIYVTPKPDAKDRRWFRLDRIVAMSFLEPPSRMNTPVIHIDGDLKNCRADNLRWEE